MLPRRETVHENQVEIHHCFSRCVRRAFLCGFDLASGKDFDHRRGWVEDRLAFLSAFFALDLITHAPMSNHLHLVLRTRPDRAKLLDPLEVARRWRAVFPVRRGKVPALETEARNARRIRSWRKRLSSLSWFMKALNEFIARRANREDGCSGHFWEGRFKNRAILDEASLLACMAYVDLNPIRAALAEKLEESAYTGVRRRIVSRQARARVKALAAERRARTGRKDWRRRMPLTEEQVRLLRKEMGNRHAAQWLAPIDARPSRPGGRLGILPLSTDEYLELLDWTGREVRAGKRGAVPAHLAPVLKRLALDVERWVDTVQRFDRLFWRVAGRAERILAAARRAGRNWLKGIRVGQQIFAPP